jgi:integrase
VREISKKRESRGRVRFLSDDERERLLKASSTSAWPPLLPLVLLAMTTGARRGELLSLTWDRVDLKKGSATLSETKNDERRILRFSGKAIEALRALKLQNSARSPYVFPHPNGRPEPYYSIDAHWYAALAEADLEDFRFHDLRHTTASYLAQQGASLLEIADVLGHKTLSMVKRYSHLTTDRKAAVIDRMVKEKGL